MLSGAFVYKIDSKGRVTLPVKFVVQLGEMFILTKGLNRCLWVLPMDDWNDMAKKLVPQTIPDVNTLALQRFFFSGAVESYTDRQYRLFIPPLLREYAQIQKDVVVVGTFNRVEIWAKEKWDEFNNNLDEVKLVDIMKDIGIF